MLNGVKTAKLCSAGTVAPTAGATGCAREWRHFQRGEGKQSCACEEALNTPSWCSAPLPCPEGSTRTTSLQQQRVHCCTLGHLFDGVNRPRPCSAGQWLGRRACRHVLRVRWHVPARGGARAAARTARKGTTAWGAARRCLALGHDDGGGDHMVSATTARSRQGTFCPGAAQSDALCGWDVQRCRSRRERLAPSARQVASKTWRGETSEEMPGETTALRGRGGCLALAARQWCLGSW